MSSRRPTPEHQEAVARRLALLSAELAASRADPPVPAEREEPGLTDGHTRLAAARASAGPEAAREGGVAPPVPVPGRHASRRRVLSGLLPETLRGRAALGPAQLTVVAVLVALGLALTCWWVVRGDAAQLAPAGVRTPSSGLVPLTPAPAPTPADGPVTTGQVTVDVAGKVRRPGIAVLDAGARVVDALRAAGGARPGADLSGLNLARVLVDGEQVVVGSPAPAGVAASAVPGAGASPGPLVNLNTATEPELEELPEIGPVTAQSIIAWRTEHGGFSSVDELLEVDGIGEATLGQLAPYVTV